jgi:DNA-3-methyladenine glycosylase I
MNKLRCGWADSDTLLQQYHDTEWGVPERNDARLLEKLILDGAQAGLSWITVLRKRENYREAFDRFDAEKIARYSKRDIARLMRNEGIIRNQLKINSAIGNAKAYLELKEAGEAFHEFLWQFTDGTTIQNRWKSLKEIPASTKESIALSKELKKRGFTFVGPTIIYAFMQATGMVNDHLVDCFRHEDNPELK